MRKNIMLAGLCLFLLSGIARTQEKSADTGPNLAKIAAWLENIKLHGDLRFRHELIDAEDDKARNRQRIRARFGLTAKVTESVALAIQVASGSGDPVSTNQSLDGGFSSKALWLDIASFDWHPAGVKGLRIIGGKQKNPFHRPGKTELIWDGDLRPEGGGVKYTKSLDRWNIFANLGGFWAEERSSAGDTGLFGAQVGAGYSLDLLGEKGHIQAGVSYFGYGNTKGKKPLYDTTSGAGNTLNGGGDYLYDFRLLECFVEVAGKVKGIPVALFGDLVVNQASGVDQDRGWLMGFTLGKCKAPQSWALRYSYRELEADAVLGAFTDSDFRGGGTGGEGHEVGFDYQIAKNWKSGISFFLNEWEIGGVEKDYHRLQVDLVFIF